MAKFCGECGAPIDEGARFCAECGAPVETEQLPVQMEPAFEQPTPVPAPMWEGGGAAVAAPPAPKQPMKKSTLITLIAVAAVVVVALAGWLIGRSVFSAENTMDQFLEALDDGDYAALSKVAFSADASVALDQRNAENMFRLYEADSYFRDLLEQTLEEQVKDPDARSEEDAVVTLVEARRLGVLPGYRVEIAVGPAQLTSSLLGATAVLDGEQTITFAGGDSENLQSDAYTVYAPAYANDSWGTASVEKLLPGQHQVTATYDTGYGHKLVEDVLLTVIPGQYSECEIYFDSQSVDVYNDSEVEISVLVDGKEQLRIPAGADGYLGPMAPDTELEARAEIEGLDAPLSQFFTAGEGYVCATFSLCELEINNYYSLPIRVYRDDKLLSTIEADEYGSVKGFPIGTKLTMRLGEDDAIAEPVEYVCEYESDYFTPEFALSDASSAALEKVVTEYITAAFAGFNNNDSAALAAMIPTGLSAGLIENLDYLGDTPDTRYEYKVTEIDLSDYEFAAGADGAMQVTVYGEIDYTLSAYEVTGGVEELYDSYDSYDYSDFNCAYRDGAWVIVPQS